MLKMEKIHLKVLGMTFHISPGRLLPPSSAFLNFQKGFRDAKYVKVRRRKEEYG
jgi:hypothetical protein